MKLAIIVIISITLLASVVSALNDTQERQIQLLTEQVRKLEIAQEESIYLITDIITEGQQAYKEELAALDNRDKSLALEKLREKVEESFVGGGGGTIEEVELPPPGGGGGKMNPIEEAVVISMDTKEGKQILTISSKILRYIYIAMGSIAGIWIIFLVRKKTNGESKK